MTASPLGQAPPDGPPALIVVGVDGDETVLTATPGRTVMEIVRDAGLPDLIALCGGCCICGTCRVVVDPAWADRLPAPVPDERWLLTGVGPEGSTPRLSCQIRMDAALDGLKVRLFRKG